jgi:hypothetical protein
MCWTLIVWCGMRQGRLESSLVADMDSLWIGMGMSCGWWEGVIKRLVSVRSIFWTVPLFTGDRRFMTSRTNGKGRQVMWVWCSLLTFLSWEAVAFPNKMTLSFTSWTLTSHVQQSAITKAGVSRGASV